MTVTEAQTWTAIGVMATTLLSLVSVIWHLSTRTVQESIGRVLDRVEELGRRLDAIDRDVQVIATRTFRTGNDQSY